MNKLISENSKKKTQRKFKPHHIPRFLPGSIDNALIQQDLREYNKHLYQVFYAKSTVDTSAPKFYLQHYFKPINIKKDLYVTKLIDKNNKDLIKKINKINRTKGIVDTYNPYAYKILTKWPKKEEELHVIECENRRLHRRIIKTKSEYPTIQYEREWRNILNKLVHTSKYPIFFLQKKTLDEELREKPSISSNISAPYKAERLKFFIEFKIEEGLSLGRIIIDLYLDYVPNVVLAFLKFTQTESFKKNRIRKVYKDKYCILGNLPNKKDKQQKHSYGEENFMLKHSKAGVLSMFPTASDRNVHLCITFDEVPELDGKQMVFGQVIWGAKNLFKINDTGSRLGRPNANIVVSKFGECSTQ